MSESDRARTRAVQPAQNRTDSVCAHIQALLSVQARDMQRRDAAIQALQAQGRRVVDGGQTGPDSWEIRDWNTGDELARGDGGIDGYDAVAERLDPDGTWVHIDHVEVESDPRPVTAGIPGSLGAALDDWLSMTSTSDEDIAEFIGWPVDKVRDHR
ncbi:hypothetical protein [Actinokineospora spheciospongiae]|uniref:hypothetical protein n=1 Tax=Actinokineospora spheciospongiae TaxID=909613 RepID=UPI000D71A7D0|nr:hypothetical protein [Actinokineospora spheciospongiae]PWW53163.1 hypothetical protein DFQ13_116153 [Actinokineospora spheciospongiae]